MMIPALFLLSSLLCRVTAFSLSAPISHAVSCRLSQRAANRNAAARRSFFFSLHPPNSSSIVSSALSSSSSDDNSSRTTSEAERLRQKAIKLRAEADAAEKQLSPTRSTRQSVVDSSNTKEVAVEYFDLKDSCWELSYRFANEPESKNDDDDNKANKMPRKFYSGKIQLQFKSDGYTTNLSTNSEIGEQQATIKKVWGWDVEISDQDSLSYILFSADITLPPPVDTSERFYFQARVDGGQKEDGEEALSLQDGSVTVKRDISAPSGGWWGIFRGADGILAQFRQVGEFRCRPIAKP